MLTGSLSLELGGGAFEILIDPSKFAIQSLPVLRQQSDQSELPGESSLNPQGLWRRSQESWHHGAGQQFFDGTHSNTKADPERFYSSSGVNPWTRGQLTLQHAVTRVRTQRFGKLISAGNYLYATDLNAQQVYWADNPTTAAAWTSSVIHAGQAATDVLSITTNGTHVWAALGASGLHRTVVGAATSTADVPATALNVVGYALGRLVAGYGNLLYEIMDPLGTPSARLIMTHTNPSFAFSGISQGRNCIYAWGNSGGAALNLSYGTSEGGNGEVYRIPLEPVGTNLGAPVQATYLPDGEQIYNVQFYAGGMLLCTGRGFRVGVADASGNIDYGPLIVGTKPVIALEPQDRYAWFSHAYGLARADLGYFTDTLTPAWASDLQELVDDTGLTHSAVSLTTEPARAFMHYSGVYTPGADPSGVYREASTYVASGWFRTGQIKFGTNERKQARRLEVKHLAYPSGCSIDVEISYDGGAFTPLSGGSVSTTVDAYIMSAAQVEVFELRFTLRSFLGTTTPTMLSWTLHALATPQRYLQITCPIIMKSRLDSGDGDGQLYDYDVNLVRGYIGQWERDSEVLTLAVGTDYYTGYIAASQFEGEHWNMDAPTPRRFMEGTLTLQFQTIEEWP